MLAKLTTGKEFKWLQYIHHMSHVLRSQSHQRFTCTFFVQKRPFFVRKQIGKLSLVTFQLCYFCAKILYEKCECKTLIKLTEGRIKKIYEIAPLLATTANGGLYSPLFIFSGKH